MTLLEMANFVCGKVNQTEAEDVAACKGFLRRRHEMIFQDQLWRDSVGEYVQTLSPSGYTLTSNWLPAKGVLLLPPDIERVLAVRTDSRALQVRSREFYYRRDFDSFAKTGTAGEFIRLKPAVWEWESAQAVLVKRGAGDATTSLVADLLDTDGVGVTRVTKILDEDFKLLGTSARVDALQASVSGDVIVGAPGSTTLTHNDAFAGEMNFYFKATAFTTVTGLTPDATLTFGQSATVTPLAYVAASNDGTGAPDDTSAVPGGANFGGTITFGGLSAFNFTRATPSGVTLAAGQTAARKRQRIRLVEIPTAELTIRVLAKLRCPAFSADSDAPAITNMDNCLLAFAQGDMLQRERQYGKANATFGEAVQLLEQLKRSEVLQEAHNLCIQPGGGYAAEYDHRGNLFSW